MRISDKLVIFDEVQHKVLKIRIYPSQDQTILINKTFGSCRKLYNEHLQERNEFYRGQSLGMDFSPAEMYINSDGKSGKDFEYVAQKQAHHKQLKKLSRRLARKQKCSMNRNKARIKLARLEEHIANSRKDWIEKESLRLVRSYGKVVVEDLNLKGISKFLRNAKNMNDTSWGMFVSRLQAKGEDYNCEVIKADRYFPSSKLCSKCGWKYEKLQLSERKWTCPKCGTNHIRDVNAAINLKNYVPLEERELTPVESDKVKSLALLALQVGSLNEAGNHSQATSGRNVLGL